MTTTERIVEAVIKAVKRVPTVLHYTGNVGDIASDSYLREYVNAAIASVIGKERPKIDLNEVEDMVQYIANRKSKLYSNNTFDEWATKLRKAIGYTLDDLTPKTDTTDGE